MLWGFLGLGFQIQLDDFGGQCLSGRRTCSPLSLSLFAQKWDSSQAWWHRSAIPDTHEAEVGELQVQGPAWANEPSSLKIKSTRCVAQWLVLP